MKNNAPPFTMLNFSHIFSLCYDENTLKKVYCLSRVSAPPTAPPVSKLFGRANGTSKTAPTSKSRLTCRRRRPRLHPLPRPRRPHPSLQTLQKTPVQAAAAAEGRLGNRGRSTRPSTAGTALCRATFHIIHP